jgi:hypothetical protein
MANWHMLAAALLLLSGCASPEANDVPTDSDGATPADQSASGPWQDVLEFEGSLTGAGYVTPVETAFYGIASQGQGFVVRDSATKLVATLVWDTPADLYLAVVGPDLYFKDHQLPDSLLERTVTFTTNDVVPGTWSVMAWVQGPAAVNYRVTVTVDYAT